MFSINRQTALINNTEFNLRVVEINIEGSITPEDFADEVENIKNKLTGPFIVCITGRAPVWGYGMLIHEAHASKAVATFDPRLGFVVVQSHTPGIEIGQTFTV